MVHNYAKCNIVVANNTNLYHEGYHHLMHVCHVCMYVCMYVCHVCMYVMYVCMYDLCMHV